MKTSFSRTLTEMKRMTDDSSKDVDAARAAADELVAFAAKQFSIIESFTELREVVATSDEDLLRSALAAIRQIHAALKELSELHKSRLLAGSFDVPFNRIHELLRKAELQVPPLLKHLEC